MDAPDKTPGLFDEPIQRGLAFLGVKLIVAVPILVVLAALAAGERQLALGLGVAFAAALALGARDVRRGAFGAATGLAGTACAALLGLLAARLI